MKKIFFMLTGLLLAAHGSAQLISYDGFEYTPGTVLEGRVNTNISGNSTWKYSGSGPNAAVAPGGLSYPGLAAGVGKSITNTGNYSSQYDYSYLTNQNFTVSTQIFASMIIKVVELTDMTWPQPVFGLRSSSGNLVGIRANGNNPANFDIGCAYNAADLTNQTARSVWNDNGGEGYCTGESILVVIAQKTSWASPKNARLWVNPPVTALGGDEPLWCSLTCEFNTLATTPTAYVYGYTGARIQMDELRTGNNYADVTPTGTVHEATTFFTY